MDKQGSYPIQAEKAYETLARKDPKLRQYFLDQVRNRFQMDHLAGIEYFDRVDDMRERWGEFFGDRMDHLVEDEKDYVTLHTINGVYEDEGERKTFMPLDPVKAVPIFAKGHKSVALVPGKAFDQWGYHEFMNALYDHEYWGHAVPYANGFKASNDPDRVVDYLGFAEMAQMDPKKAFPMFFTFSEVAAHDIQINNGMFSRLVDPGYKKRIENSMLVHFARLWDFPQSAYRDALIDKYFHMPWVYDMRAVLVRKNGSCVLMVKTKEVNAELEVPDSLKKRLSF